MKFSINQSNLQKTLSILSKAVAIKTTMDILKGIYIETDNDKLILKTYNLDMAITTTVPAVIEEEGKVVLEFSLLNDINRRMPTDSIISFNCTEKKVTIKCENSVYNLNQYNSDEYPIIPVITKENSFNINQQIFANMIRLTNFAVSKEESRPVLTGSLIEANNSKLTMVSIDGYCIAKKVVDIDYDKNLSVIVPGKTLSEIEKIIGNDITEDIEILIKDNHIGFNFSNINIISKVLDGEYVNYNQILKNDFKSKIIIDKENLFRAIDRTSLLSFKSNLNLIILEFSEDNLNVYSDTSLGFSKEDISINSELNMRIGMNPNYLIKALKVMDTEKIEFNIDSNNKPCLIKPYDDESYEYYVVPIRIRDVDEVKN